MTAVEAVGRRWLPPARCAPQLSRPVGDSGERISRLVARQRSTKYTRLPKRADLCQRRREQGHRRSLIYRALGSRLQPPKSSTSWPPPTSLRVLGLRRKELLLCRAAVANRRRLRTRRVADMSSACSHGQARATRERCTTRTTNVAQVGVPEPQKNGPEVGVTVIRQPRCERRASRSPGISGTFTAR
jgi:hypothetical protein